MAIPVETNKTGSNIDAWSDYITGKAADVTYKAKVLLDGPTGEYVAKKLNDLVWGSTLFVAQRAPGTFIAAALPGLFFGTFSPINMKNIFQNTDEILSGGTSNKNTNFKVTLILAYVLVRKIFRFPALDTVMAGIAGLALGVKLAEWTSDSFRKNLGQKIDATLNVPKPSPTEEDHNPDKTQ